jgi:hypothetical protein
MRNATVVPGPVSGEATAAWIVQNGVVDEPALATVSLHAAPLVDPTNTAAATVSA